MHIKDEDTVIELTLPMVTISDLIEDAELDKLRKNRQLLQQFAREIPEVLTQFYLFYNAPNTP